MAKILAAHPDGRAIIKRNDNKVVVKGREQKILVKCYGDASGTAADQNVGAGIASEAISAYRCVALSNGELVMVDQTVSVDGMVGVSLQAAAIGGALRYRAIGHITDPAFAGLAVNTPLFCAPDASLTAIPPSTGWLHQVASVIDVNTIRVMFNASDAVLRA